MRYPLTCNPESFCERRLKGRSEKEIRKVISALRQEYLTIRNRLTSAGNCRDIDLEDPPLSVQLENVRQCLANSRSFLAGMGCEVTVAPGEARAERFEALNPTIERIDIITYGFLGITHRRSVLLTDDGIYSEYFFTHDRYTDVIYGQREGAGLKAQFVEAFTKLRTGEWTSAHGKNKDEFAEEDCVRIRYSEAPPRNIRIANNTPWNYGDLSDLLEDATDELHSSSVRPFGRTPEELRVKAIFAEDERTHSSLTEFTGNRTSQADDNSIIF